MCSQPPTPPSDGVSKFEFSFLDLKGKATNTVETGPVIGAAAGCRGGTAEDTAGSPRALGEGRDWAPQDRGGGTDSVWAPKAEEKSPGGNRGGRRVSGRERHDSKLGGGKPGGVQRTAGVRWSCRAKSGRSAQVSADKLHVSLFLSTGFCAQNQM